MVIFMLILVLLIPFSATAQSVNLALNKPYVINHEADSPYLDIGKKELTDGKYGSLSLHDPNWQGHARKDYRIVVLDLGATYKIDDVALSFLKDEPSNVWYTYSLSLAGSNDGVDWFMIENDFYPSKDLPKEKTAIAKLSLDGKGMEARYLAIRFHVGFWVFIDELEVWGENIPLGNESAVLGQGLDNVDYYKIHTLMNDYYNKGQYDSVSGEFLRVSEKTAWTKDILLVYDQATGINWNETYAYPYVAYLDDEKQPKDWFFDTFLFLALTTNSGRNFQTIPYADKTDWEWWLEREFEPGHGFDAFNQAVIKAGELMGDSEYKAKVIVMIPYPIEDSSHPYDKNNPGYLDPAKVGREKAAQNRVEVVKWWIEEIEKRFSEANYERLELVGYYWLAEHVDLDGLDRTYLPLVGDLVREKGRRFFWIPWFLAHGYSEGEALGFDAVMMQPNYMFDKDHFKARLMRTAAEAKKFGLGVEIEADPIILTDRQKRERYYDYLRSQNTLGYGNDVLRSYYQDVYVLFYAVTIGDYELREIYDNTYEFVKGKFEEELQGDIY